MEPILNSIKQPRWFNGFWGSKIMYLGTKFGPNSLYTKILNFPFHTRALLPINGKQSVLIVIFISHVWNVMNTYPTMQTLRTPSGAPTKVPNSTNGPDALSVHRSNDAHAV